MWIYFRYIRREQNTELKKRKHELYALAQVEESNTRFTQWYVFGWVAAKYTIHSGDIIWWYVYYQYLSYRSKQIQLKRGLNWDGVAGIRTFLCLFGTPLYFSYTTCLWAGTLVSGAYAGFLRGEFGFEYSLIRLMFHSSYGISSNKRRSRIKAAATTSPARE